MKFENGSRPAYLVAVAMLMAALAAPALAGSYYTWTTEDGTVAFTDDERRIPARYRAGARQEESGALEDYPRFTEVGAESADYQNRLEARLQGLRARQGGGELPAVSSGPPRATTRVEQVSGSGISRTRVAIPAGQGGADEPVVTEEYRVKPQGSIATRDITVTRQGDKVIAVQKAPRNQRRIDEDPDL